MDDAGAWNPNQGGCALPGDYSAAEMDRGGSPGPHTRGWRGELFTPPEARLVLTLILTPTLTLTLTVALTLALTLALALPLTLALSSKL